MTNGTRAAYDRIFGTGEEEDEEDDAPLTVASAEEISAAFEEGEILVLPGIGKPVRLRPITPLVLATRAGKIPNPMIDQVVRLMAIQTDPLDRMSEAKQVQVYKDNGIAFQYAASLMIIEPPFAMPPKDAAEDWRPPRGHIGPMHLKERDYLFLVYTYMQGSAENLLPFRRANRVRRSPRSGEGVRRAPEHVLGTDGEGEAA
jgi:hypothetical protein